MHAPPACDGTFPPAGQPAAKLLAARPPLHTLDSEELIKWAREYACVEEKGLASVARACREAGLDGAALCGVPNADVLREVYKIEEWGVRIKLMKRAHPYRRAAEQQGAPASTDGGAAAAVEGNRKSRAAELATAVPAVQTAFAKSQSPAGLSAPAGAPFTFKMPESAGACPESLSAPAPAPAGTPFTFQVPGLAGGGEIAFSLGQSTASSGVVSGAAASAPPGPFTFKMLGSAGAKPAFSFGQGSAPASQPAFFSGRALTSKMSETPEDGGAVVQALLHRTANYFTAWPVRCLCLRHTVGTSSQLTVRAWCPNENCDSAHLHRIATSRGCSRRRRGSCSPRWPTRD
jgi:hypothetical protein